MPYSLMACMHYIHIYLSTITVLHPFSSLQYPQVHLRPFFLSSTNHKMFNTIACHPHILQSSLATAAFGSMTLSPPNPTTMRKEESQVTTHTMLIILSLDPKLHGLPQTYSRRYLSKRQLNRTIQFGIYSIPRTLEPTSQPTFKPAVAIPRYHHQLFLQSNIAEKLGTVAGQRFNRQRSVPSSKSKVLSSTTNII